MKKILLSLVAILATISVSFATTYYWVGGTAATFGAVGTLSTTLGGTGNAVSYTGMNTAGNPDIFIFDGTDISSSAGAQTGTVTVTLPSGATTYYGQIIAQNSAVVVTTTGGTRTLNIVGGIGVDFLVNSGCSFSTSGSSTIIAINTGATGEVSGSLTIGSGSNVMNVTSPAAGALTFKSGSTCIAQHGSGGPFGTAGTNGSVVFESGSLYVQNTSSGNPFQLTAPNALVVFNSGSTYRQDVSAAPAMTGRTYGNFIWNNTGTQSLTGATVCTIQNSLTIAAAGTVNLNLSGGVIIGGDIAVNAGTLTFSPGSAANVTFNGTVAQTISNAGTLTWGTNANIVVSNSSTGLTGGVKFNYAPTITGTTTVNTGSILRIGAATSAFNGGCTVNGTFQIDQGAYATGTFTYAATGSKLIWNNSTGPYGPVNTHSYWPATNSPYNVSVIGAGGVNFGSIVRTINGTFTYQAPISNYCSVTYAGPIVSSGSASPLPMTCGTYPNYVVHQSSVTTVSNPCSGSGSYWNMTPTAGNALVLQWNIENKNSWTQTGIYYTTDGSTPSGNHGIGFGTTQYIVGSWICTDGSNREIATATIPSSVNVGGVTVKYKIGAWYNAASTEAYATTTYTTQVQTGNTYSYSIACITGTWIGGTSTNWATAANWSCGTIPTSSIDVTIPSGTTFSPTVSSGAVAKSVTINSGATLNGGSNTLSISGNWIDNGTFIPATGTIAFVGTSAQSVSKASGTESFNHLTVNNTSGAYPALNFSSNITLAGDLIVTAGNIRNTSGSAKTITMTGSAAALTINGSVEGTNVGAGNDINLVVSGSTTLSGSGNPCLFFTTTVNSGATLALARAIDVKYGSFNVYGKLRIDNGGSVVNDILPIYDCASTLQYNYNGNIAPGYEWVSISGAGYPGNVQISNSTTLTLPASNRATCGNLVIDAGCVVTMSNSLNTLSVGNSLTINGTLNMGTTIGGDISVNGNWTRNTGGVFNPNNRAVFFVGTAASTITAPVQSSRDANGSFGGETFPYLTMNKANNTNTVTNAVPVVITRVLTLTKGTLNLGDSNFVLVSNASNTADVARITTPSDVIVNYDHAGRFVVQRFIPNTSTVRTWRFLTAPFLASDPLTINQAWQEGKVNTDYTNPSATNPWPGFGTHITGPKGTYDASKGFDQGPTNTGYSIEYFDNSTGTSKWSYPANTNSTPLMSKLGWGIFIRGDRSFVIGDQYVASGNTTLEPKGKINIGDVTSTVTGGGALFNVVGNPYPCQINMTNVNVGGSTQAQFSLWDPKAFTNYTQTGKYIPFTWISGTSYAASNSPITSWASPGTVESSEAFLVKSIGTSVVFHETDKVSGTSSLNGIQSRPASPQGIGTVSFFRSYLAFYDSATTSFTNIDGTLNLYNPTYNTSVSSTEDAISPLSASATGAIRIKKDGYQLAISKEQNIASTDTVHYFISTLIKSKHRLALTATDYLPGVTAILVDSYLNSTMPVSVINGDTTFYEFDVTADVQSNRSDRFSVVFEPVLPLPVNFIAVRASKQSAGISLKWEVANEVDTKEYQVEKSTDGFNFTKIGTVVKNTDHVFLKNWLDASPFDGNNYYRVCMIDKMGSKNYSLVVKVYTGTKIEPCISVYPNPVIDNVVGVQMNNMPEGKYVIKVINSSGQAILNKTIQHSGGSYSETLSLESNISKGKYTLEVKGGNQFKRTINLIH